jgi:hypothetical protein
MFLHIFCTICYLEKARYLHLAAVIRDRLYVHTAQINKLDSKISVSP